TKLPPPPNHTISVGPNHDHPTALQIKIEIKRWEKHRAAPFDKGSKTKVLKIKSWVSSFRRQSSFAGKELILSDVSGNVT
nr:hypothetical protein [Tanacetum cinerariifolium]